MKKDNVLSNFCKKLVAIIFALTLVLAGVCFLSTEGTEVLASDSNTPAFQVRQLNIEQYTSRDSENNIVRTAPKPDVNSNYKDWIFAGWYKDATCTTTVSKTTDSGTYYAKFVPAEVLSAKCQVSADTNETTPTSKLRIVSTVDSLKYGKVGFDLVFNGNTIPYSTNKVYSKIEAATEGVKYGFSPNIFDLQSEYFITATLINIKNEDFDEGILIKPYWVTRDGTKVYGVSRYARVEDSYLGIVNVPVRLYSDEKAVSGTATITYDASKLEYQETYSSTLLAGENSTIGYENGYVFDGITEVKNSVNDTTGTIHVTAASDVDATTDGMLVNLRLKIKDKNALPKKNTFVVTTNLKNTSDTEVSAFAPNVVYTYFKTGTYTGTADIQWYDTNKTGTEFVITTPEELYGFASLVNNRTITNQKVYLGADITINSNWTAGETEPTYPWTPIGTSYAKENIAFAGTFDGQGHSISGLYVNDTSTDGYIGMFAQASGEIKNFSLENSYFASKGAIVGSVVGFLTGGLDSVYSKATVVNNAEFVQYQANDTGGLVGRFGGGQTVSISNCWFDGSVTSNNRGLGGLVGHVANGPKSITHCLNTGTVQVTNVAGAQAGGLVGRVAAQTATASLTLTDSMNTGTISNPNNVTVVGSVIGIILADHNPTVTITNTYATTESYSVAVGVNMATQKGTVNQCKKAELTGFTGYLKADLDFYTDINKADGGYWVVNAGDTPTLKSFSDIWADTGWYFDDDDITTYEINTVEELYGLAALSQYYDFAGETIKLTADIKTNEGDATNWGTIVPKNAWTPIGRTLPFKGTFDGQGHTISGIYAKSDQKTGLFGTTKDATIKNLQLKNCYIHATGSWAGSVVGYADGGTFDTIYSDAIVQADVSVSGGIIGALKGQSTANNCWFDGYVGPNMATETVGGIVGNVDAKTVVKNCLNTGTIRGNAYIGGIVGRVSSGITLMASSNVNEGSVISTLNRNAGHIVGLNQGTSNIVNSYGLDTNVAIALGGTLSEEHNGIYDIATVKGNGAFVMTGLDFTDYWVAKEGTTPELRSFTTKEGNSTVPATQEYIGWYNTWDNEYTISTATGLYGLSKLSATNDFSGKKICLSNDIVLNEGILDPAGTATDWESVYSKWNAWIPIGRTLPFKGTFDGQGHTISGIYVSITQSGNAYAGLFGQTSNATIQNLRLENSYIYADTYFVGGVVGCGSGTFDTIYSDAIVTADISVVGGLIGMVNANSEINNCWFAGKVNKTNKGDEAGGIVGSVQANLIIGNCLNTGSVSGYGHVSGIVGQVRPAGTLTATNNLNVGAISASVNGGNILGNNAGTAKIAHSYGVSDYAIGNGTITQTGNSTYAKTDIQGDKAFALTGLDYTNYWVAKSDVTPELASFTTDIDSIETENDQAYIGWYNGAGSENIITTAAGLRGLSELSETNNFRGATIKLGNDIILNEGTLEPNGKEADWNATIEDWTKWTPIGQSNLFNGTFDGQGHTIHGVYVTDTKAATENSYVGLFAQTNVNAVIQDLRVEDSYIQGGGYYVGSIAGYSAGTQYTNVYSCAIVKGGSAMTGGLVGAVQSAGGTFSSCWYDGVMKLSDNGCQAGGIVGVVRNDTCTVTMNNCLNTGNIDSSLDRTDHWIGGLVGALRIVTPNVTIRNSLNVGTITVAGDASDGIGAIVGRVDAGTLDMNNTVYGITGDYKALGSANTGTTVTDKAVLVARENLLGDNAIANASALFADGTTWTTVIDGTPVLDQFTDEVKVVADTSWYDASKKEFTITTAAELFGLSELSKTKNFKGKTIKLGADITTNTGKATNWATEAPINKWTPIAEFAGIFDGQGHTISGIYVNANGNVGLFAKTTESAVVKDIQLKNSYIYSTHDNNGSIAGIGNGTFDTIYSDAIVVCNNRYYTGGIVGIVDSGNQNKINNTQFNGSVQMKGTTGYYGGGIVGTVYGSGVELTLSNCLSSGSVGTERKDTQVVGGLCGATYSGGTILINSCMHTGTFDIDQNYVVSIGSVIGNIADGTTAKVLNTYVTSSDYQDTYTGTTSVTSTVVDVESIKGNGAFNMTGLDFTTYWTAKEGALLELKSFASNTVSLPVPGTQVYDGWYDGSGEYTITTAAGLYGFAKLSKNNGFSGETIKLGADITLNEGKATEWSATNTPENLWQPIGTGTNFFGTFDGQGHTISGMYVNGGTGLFHYTKSGSTIRNLKLKNSYVYNSTDNYVGSIAGKGIGTFDSVYSDAIVETTGSNYYIGGLVGGTFNDASGTITNMSQCWFDGTVKLGASGYYAGGMVGSATGATTLTMRDCLMTGMVTGSRTGAVYIGGLCGSAYGGTIELENSLYAGTMTVASGTTCQDSVIGAIGNNGKASIGHTYVTAKVNETGVGGSTTPTGSVSVVDSNAIKGDDAFAAMSGLDFTDKWAAVAEKTPELATFSTAERVLPDGTWAYDGWYDGGTGTYTVTTAAGLRGLSKLSADYDFMGSTILLGADIVLNEGTLNPNDKETDWAETITDWKTWTPIGKSKAFAGVFDGQGHTISGLYVDDTVAKVGLFGQTTKESTIQKLGLENSYISSGGYYVGSIVGYGDGNVHHVYSTAIIKSSNYYVGGIVGFVKSGIATSGVTNCWYNGNIILTGSNGYYAGGIVGTVQDTTTTVTIENCLNSGSISWERTSSPVAIGGLCGATWNYGNVVVNKSLHVGDLKAGSGAGTGGAGLAIGYIPSGNVTITDTYAIAGTISAGVGERNASGAVTPITRENLLGDNAKTNASALFTDGTTWTTITDGIPVLTNFKEYGVVESDETLLGAPLSRYRIVISEDATTLMELLAGYLKSQIAEKTGVTLEVVKDTTSASDYEIVLGCTTRDVSSQLYTKGAYSVSDYSYALKNDGNSISVGYTDSPALVDAFTKLLDIIANDDATSIDVARTYDMTKVKKAEDSYIRVMSSNIYTSLDTSFDYLNMPYQARAELLAECYLLYKPDFIGWQEADKAMRDEVYKYIAHEYQIVEFDMSGNNWCPIFYRKDLYNLETSDYYQFSQFDANSNVVLDSMHYCEWALYSSKSNPEEQFIHMNIHYNVSERSALPQAIIVNKMIQKLMAQYPDVPIAITGDYNFTATESVFKTMMRGIDDKVQSGSQILKNEDSKYYTWHILGNLELSETYKSIQQGPIDHVSITTDLLEAKEYKIIHYPLICWAADHYPIFLDVAVK